MAEINWYGDERKADVREMTEKACQRAAKFAVGSVRQEITAPDLIDTGNLLNSIDDEQVDWDHCRVGTNVFYAIFLEYGTRFMGAKAFMRKALDRDSDAIEKLIRATMSGG
jgi:HK97 gp10 family phage protein